jgi:hypothetical protein
MNYQGNIALGDTIDIKFTTVNSTGVPTTLAGSPAVAAYVDNATTEITAGITLTVDFDARAGLHNVRVVASSGNGFAASNVNLIITAGTVAGNSVAGYVIGSFSIDKRPVNVTKWAGTANTTGDIAIKTSLAKTTHITGFNDLSAAQVNTEADTALADVGMTTTVTGRIDAAVSTRSTYAGTDTSGTTTLLTRLPSALTITAGAVNVNDKTGFALTSVYDPAKTAATQASVNTIDDFVDTEVSAIKAVTDKLDTAMELDGAVYRYTVNALEQAPAGGGGGTTDWTSTERDQIRHRLGIDGTATAPSTGNPSLPDAADITQINTKLDAINGAVDTEVAAIKAKTDNLPADPASAGTINTSFSGVNTKLDTIDDFLDTEIAAIKAKTDQMVFTGGKIDANAVVALTAADLNSIADAVLKRDWSLLTGEAAYSLLNAARMLRNVWNTPSGVLHVKKEDGTTDAWTRTLAVDPAAQPIVGAS